MHRFIYIDLRTQFWVLYVNKTFSVQVSWSPMNGPAQLKMALRCLSTDFTSQRGVKGIPLVLQIGTSIVFSLNECQLVNS